MKPHILCLSGCAKKTDPLLENGTQLIRGASGVNMETKTIVKGTLCCLPEVKEAVTAKITFQTNFVDFNQLLTFLLKL